MTRATLAVLALAVLPASVDAQFGGRWKTDFSRHTVPLDEIVSGGPPKDGIPAVDRPVFIAVEEADDWLDDREPIVLVRLNGDAKAYPIQILIWHEIVNDLVGGIPVTVTFCPLCNTALAFDRRHEGHVLDFGTTGRLRNSDLVMYDRQTESWWQQATGEGIVGEFAGSRLTFIPSPVVNWGTFKQTYPDGRVLSRDTGYRRRYGDSPYARYDRGRGPFARFFSGRRDDRLDAMERVAAVERGDETAAFPFAVLRERRVVQERVGGDEIVVFWAPGTVSALDARRIRQGRDVGSTGVFLRQVKSRRLTFSPAGDGRYRDDETGSTWDVLGRAVAGRLAGTQLEEVPHGNHFWFAWAAFKPETRIVR